MKVLGKLLLIKIISHYLNPLRERKALGYIFPGAKHCPTTKCLMGALCLVYRGHLAALTRSHLIGDHP